MVPDDDLEFTHFHNEETMPGYLTNIDKQTLDSARAEVDGSAIERWEDEGGRVSSTRGAASWWAHDAVSPHESGAVTGGSSETS
jgi:hypothetical protein